MNSKTWSTNIPNVSYLLFFIVQIQLFVSFYLHFRTNDTFENRLDYYIQTKLKSDDTKMLNCAYTCNLNNQLLTYNQKSNRFKRDTVPEEWQNLFTMAQEITKKNHGPPGLPGKPGPRGQKGEPGEKGMQGLPGPSGSRGAPGARGIDGYKGDKGDVGVPGFPGISGRRGVQGEKGEKGVIGSIGAPGYPGARGTLGPQGPPGPRGPIGEKGEKGEAGFQGTPGAKGSRGIQGDRGDKGDAGISGVQGLIGPPGVPGIRGVSGPQGNRGEKGSKGESGFQGPPGANGKAGLNGEGGQKGDAGVQGVAGYPGDKGERGECKCGLVNENMFTVAKYGRNSYPKYSEKTIDCMMENINFEKFVDDSQGTWLKDEYINNKDRENKIWTVDIENNELNEYVNDETLKKNNRTRSYNLFMLKEENAYMVYKESLIFVHSQKNPIVFRYFLNNGTSQILSIPELTIPNSDLLYNTGKKMFDLSADENGLWIIFAVPFTKNTGIIKLNPHFMTVEQIWNATLSHKHFNKMFVAHGKLYGVVVEDKMITIPVGIDLYENHYNNIEFTIVKPTQNIMSVNFNSNTDKLMVWDEATRWEIPFLCYNVYVSSNVNVE